MIFIRVRLADDSLVLPHFPVPVVLVGLLHERAELCHVSRDQSLTHVNLPLDDCTSALIRSCGLLRLDLKRGMPLSFHG